MILLICVVLLVMPFFFIFILFWEPLLFCLDESGISAIDFVYLFKEHSLIDLSYCIFSVCFTNFCSFLYNFFPFIDFGFCYFYSLYFL